MSNVSIAIVTVNLNSGDSLRKTVKSIFDQRCKPDKFIIKDGISEDYPENIVEEYFINNSLFISKEDCGIYDAMNQAIECVNEDYCMFLNSGDSLLDKDTIDIIRTIIGKQSNNAAMTYFDYFDSNGNMVKSPRNMSKFTLFRHVLCHQACVYKTEVLKELNGYSIEYKVCSDVDMLFKILNKYKIKHYSIPIVIMEKQGFSNINQNTGIREMKIIRKKYFTKADKYL